MFLGQQMQTGTGDIVDTLGRATNYVRSGTQGARDALTSVPGALDYGPALASLDAGQATARGLYDDARTEGRNALGAYDALAGLGTKYGGATSLALNALGVNGADAANTARGSFMTSPGYNFNLDQGLEAINRRRAAGGMLASGNADRDAQNYGAGLASNEYNTWMNNLLGFTNPELSATSGAASGRAGAYTNLANLNTGEAGLVNSGGVARAGLEAERARLLNDLATRYAGLSDAEGRTLAGLETDASRARVGLNTTLSQPYANTYKQEADAQTAGSANMLKFGMAAAQMAMGMPPMSLGSLGGASSANAGVSGGGYLGTGGQVYPGPGFYG